jgi:hypothetical protein
MIDQIRYIWQLLVLSLSLLILGILAIPRMDLDLDLHSYMITVISVTGINLAAWFVITRGIRRGEREGMVLLLAGIGLKFVLYLLYILVFWMVTKIISKPFIVVFFALYLGFTFLLAVHLLKLLKNK